MYKICLADGTEVEFSGMNGDNFIVPDQKEMDVSVFTDDNLKSVTITNDDGNTAEFENLSFTQQQKQKNGDYYICFHQKTDQEVKNEELEAEVESLKKSVVSIAEAEISLGNITADDLDGAIRDTVKADIEGGLVKDFP